MEMKEKEELREIMERVRQEGEPLVIEICTLLSGQNKATCMIVLASCVCSVLGLDPQTKGIELVKTLFQMYGEKVKVKEKET